MLLNTTGRASSSSPQELLNPLAYPAHVGKRGPFRRPGTPRGGQL